MNLDTYDNMIRRLNIPLMSYNSIPRFFSRKFPARNVVTDRFYYQRLSSLEKCIDGLKGVHESERQRNEFRMMYGKSKLASLYGEFKGGSK